jgi:coenzyme F420-dependent glucose-6-phosphate dehydrogenase
VVRVSCDPQRHIDWLQQDIELGFSGIYLHNVNRNQREFIDAFGEQVLPALRGINANETQAKKNRKE